MSGLEAWWAAALGLAHLPLPRGGDAGVAVVSGDDGLAGLALTALRRVGLTGRRMTPGQLREAPPMAGCVLFPDGEPAPELPWRERCPVVVVAPESPPGVLSAGGVRLPGVAWAAQALAALHARREWLERPPREVVRYPVNRRRAGRFVVRCQRQGGGVAGEEELKGILAAYDFRVPPGGMACTREEAVVMAESLGFPVVVKGVAPGVVRKGVWGGVFTGVVSANGVRDAWDLIAARLGRHHPGARLAGVHVESQMPPGREVTMGFRRDPRWGVLLRFGLAGVVAETLLEGVCHPAPVTREEALAMLRGSRSFDLLERLADAIDREALVGALQRLSQLAEEFGAVNWLDIHPLVVGPPGREPVVLGVRGWIAPEGGGEVTHVEP